MKILNYKFGRRKHLQETRNKTFIDKIWDSLASVKLAIIIFAVISLTSIVGTVLEQRAEPARNILILSKLFGESAAPVLYSIFDNLGFMNMYRSWWFTGLLVIFSVNLIICSLDRLPRIWKLVREPVAPMSEDQLRKFFITREKVLKGKPDDVRDFVKDALKSARFECAEAKEENGYQFYAQKGAYSRLGVYLTHFSILVILLGAVIGIRFGFKGYLNLPEGAVSNVAISNADREIPLGFYIRCDNFEVEFYGNSDMPKEYRSWLTIIKDDREVLQKSIVVNDPLKYEGITFYQSSYGLVPGSLDRGVFIFNIVSRDGKASTINLRLGDTFHLPESDISGKIIDFSPALKFDSQGHAVTYANQMNNPAALIQFSDGGSPKFSGWILKRHPETWQLPEGGRVEFMDYWGVEYTGMQVRKDPGVWIVYLGCIAMSLGLFIALFLSHRKIWVKLIEDKNNTRVIISATTNKNRSAFERKIDGMISVLSKKQAGGK